VNCGSGSRATGSLVTSLMERRELAAAVVAAGSAAVVVVADGSAAAAGALGPGAPGAGVG
jgi:hypothetical protein